MGLPEGLHAFTITSGQTMGPHGMGLPEGLHAFTVMILWKLLVIVLVS